MEEDPKDPKNPKKFETDTEIKFETGGSPEPPNEEPNRQTTKSDNRETLKQKNRKSTGVRFMGSITSRLSGISHPSRPSKTSINKGSILLKNSKYSAQNYQRGVYSNADSFTNNGGLSNSQQMLNSPLMSSNEGKGGFKKKKKKKRNLSKEPESFYNASLKTVLSNDVNGTGNDKNFVTNKEHLISSKMAIFLAMICASGGAYFGYFTTIFNPLNKPVLQGLYHKTGIPLKFPSNFKIFKNPLIFFS